MTDPTIGRSSWNGEDVALLPALTAFAAAFGYVEGAVVVYVRALICPEGFCFPLAAIPERILWTEAVREAATIVLLLGTAFAATREGYRRFAAFAYCFGIWDLAYYGTLKVILDWPRGWLDWDLLFLLPLPWIGPVLAPCLVSLALVGCSLLLLSLPPGVPCPLRRTDWLLQVAGGSAIIASFLWNWEAAGPRAVPETFPWWLFGLGCGLGLGDFVWAWRRPRPTG